MDSHDTNDKKSSNSASSTESEPLESKESLLVQEKPTESDEKKSNGPKDPNEMREIPALDDMTSYLFSHESINKDNLTPIVPTQSKQPVEIPKIASSDNGNKGIPSLLVGTRDKSDSSVSMNQTTNDEVKKEIEILFKNAQLLSSHGEYKEAINYYNRIIALNEKSSSAWIAKGHCHAMLGQDMKALTTYQQVLKMFPNSQKDEQLWYGIGVLYQKFEEWNNAEISFRNSLRLEPKPELKAEVLYSLATVLKEKGDYAESVKMFTNSILTEVFPPERVAEILCQNGDLQEKMNDITGALKTYQYALMINDGHPKALLHAGWLSFQQDKIEQALGYMKKAESMIPNEPNIIYVIAKCYLKLKQHTIAYDCLHKCLTKDPTNSIYWSSLGILFAELIQLQESYDCLSKAVKFNPNTCPEHFFNLGCLFELSNQAEDALSMYDRALETDPTFSLAAIRKKIVLSQRERKPTTLEVQFKHPTYVFPFPSEVKEKHLISLPPTNTSVAPLDELFLLNTSTSDIKTKKIKEVKSSQKFQPKEPKEDDPQTGSTNKTDKALSLKPVPLGLLASKLESQKDGSSKGFNPQSSNLGPDVSSLTLSRPSISEPSGTKLPSVQSLSSTLSSLNSFSILQNNFSNVNNFLISPLVDYTRDLSSSEQEQIGTLLSNRAKTDDLSSVIPNDLAKQLGGLKALLGKNVSVPQSNLMSGLSIDSLKATKNISSPIVLKHNPQGLLANESYKKNGGSSEIRSQNKVEIKVLHKPAQGDDDDHDEYSVTKKVKLHTLVKNGSALPTEN